MEGLVLLVNGPDEARAAVRKLVKDGVEWVKTYPTGDAAAPDTNDHHTLCMTFDEMHAVVATAHNHRMKVTGHCRATEGIKNALRAGYDTLEHGTFMDDEALETLTCATKTGAEIMGRGEEFGTLEPGKLADLLVVDGDVLEDISILEDRSWFVAVMQGGVVKAGMTASGFRS